MGGRGVPGGSIDTEDGMRGVNLRAWIELARLSNAPTIVTNVLVGIAVGAYGLQSTSHTPWLVAFAMSAAILLLYIAGMALNDALDANIDRIERPNRPIPSGRISLQSAYAFASICMGVGVAIAAIFGLAPALLAATLVLAIVIYNVLHKRFAGAVLFMGLCRGLVYLTAAAAVAWPIQWEVAIPFALALTLFIMFITLIARGESSERGVSPIAMRLSILLVAVALAPALWVTPTNWLPAVIAALILIGWLVASQRFLIDRPPRVKSAVMAFLAGICLVDAYYLALLDQVALMSIAWACFVITMLAHRRISGT